MSEPRPSSIFARGAVDLSTLRTTPARSTEGGPVSAGTVPAAGAARTGTGVAIVDVTEATFQTEVAERSLTNPVVIDFWAEWCGPCRQLSPVLERLATEDGGAWTLAKINVDANPRLAQLFQVQSIPMVIAVVGGRPVDAFTGVVPQPQLRQWIDALLRLAGVQPGKPKDPRLVEAENAVAAGDLDRAEQAYRSILAETPSNTDAESGLAHVQLLRRVDGVDPDEAARRAEAAPDDIDAQLLAADLQVLSGDAPAAYTRLVDLVRRSAGEDRDRVRAHLVSLFTVAEPDDPAVAKARRALASALY